MAADAIELTGRDARTTFICTAQEQWHESDCAGTPALSVLRAASAVAARLASPKPIRYTPIVASQRRFSFRDRRLSCRGGDQ